MLVITDTGTLETFCSSLRKAPFITVDTEFMRERTYWPVLCLVQIAGPDEAAIIDVLADGIDLAPLFSLMNDPDVLKVFHAARQDIEIFHHLTGRIPAPVFDTQIAAMVCGFGESVGYETLVAKLAKARIDKSMRFTDWARRPLSEKQLHYALSDVTHLRIAYERLSQDLEASGRRSWLSEEMAILESPDTYVTQPEEAWLRLKPRTNKPRFLAVLRELAAWRERMAQERDVPRSRIVRDDVLLDIAARMPANRDDLAKTRSFSRSGINGVLQDGLLAAVAKGLAVKDRDCPSLPPRPAPAAGIGPLVDLLRVLLKTCCDDHGVAQKLVASGADLERIASEAQPDVPALTGWRFDVFGSHAMALKEGRLALAAAPGRVRILPVTPSGSRDKEASGQENPD